MTASRNHGKTFRRIVATWFVDAGAVFILAKVLDGFVVSTLLYALALAAVIGLLNALVWPLFIRFLLPVTVLTLGLASLVLNGIFVVAAVWLIDDTAAIYIDDWTTGVWVAIGITIINSLFTRLLAIDDDDFYYRNIIARQARRKKFTSTDKSNRTGVLFLEIDGLAHDILQRAIGVGIVPNMARWLHKGNYRLVKWECDWSSQTGAMQAGILHGNNWDMPSFRWYEKDTGKVVVSNHTKDAMEIERRRSNGKGLLHQDGASRANLLSGDAPHSSITMSTVLNRTRKSSLGADYMAFFSNPYNALRVLTMAVAEIVKEIYQQRVQARRNIQPRVHRGLFPYPLLRAFTNVFQRELGVSATIQDIYAGRPVIYTMFLGYDEVAHHSGPERPETMAELGKIDRAFGRLELAIKSAKRRYQIVVLSDHGQTQGATFAQRYGQSLEQLVHELTSADTKGVKAEDEGLGFVRAAKTEMHQAGGFVGVLAKLLPRVDDNETKTSSADVTVLPSGGLGSINFVNKSKRVSLEELEAYYPDFLDRLVRHKGIGFVLVDSQKDGALVIGATGRHYLKTGKVEGRDPLRLFGPNASKHVARTSSFPHCPDVVINSTYWPKTNEVAAFEELVGSHGAMGGPQQYPFIFYPSSLKASAGQIIGAENVHKQFRRWLVDLGWTSYS